MDVMVPVADAQLHVEITGEGPPLLLWHSVICAGWMWAAIPGAKLRMVPKAGHLCALEILAFVTAAIREFLDTIPGWQRR